VTDADVPLLATGRDSPDVVGQAAVVLLCLIGAAAVTAWCALVGPIGGASCGAKQERRLS